MPVPKELERRSLVDGLIYISHCYNSLLVSEGPCAITNPFPFTLHTTWASNVEITYIWQSNGLHHILGIFGLFPFTYAFSTFTNTGHRDTLENACKDWHEGTLRIAPPRRMKLAWAKTKFLGYGVLECENTTHAIHVAEALRNMTANCQVSLLSKKQIIHVGFNCINKCNSDQSIFM